jgi:Glyoxalase/Bleomycin resistance protein/Dioxygenase superfamily
MTGAARPAAGLFADPREVTALGDLFANIWQIAYVTRDLDAGMELLRDRFGVESTEVPTAGATFLAGDGVVPWDVRISMGARGGQILELIEPVGGEVEFYRRSLPPDGPGLGLHHLATFVPVGEAPWSSVLELLAAEGLRVEYTMTIPDRVRAGYVDTTPMLGHWLEICQLQPADIELFTGLIEQSA